MNRERWDRLLETCRRQGTDLLLAPGSPPMVRTPIDWRSLQRPALSLGDVQSMAVECLAGADRVDADGYGYCDFSWGEGTWYRARAFGFPDTTLLMISLTPDPATFNTGAR